MAKKATAIQGKIGRPVAKKKQSVEINYWK